MASDLQFVEIVVNLGKSDCSANLTIPVGGK